MKFLTCCGQNINENKLVKEYSSKTADKMNTQDVLELING